MDSGSAAPAASTGALSDAFAMDTIVTTPPALAPLPSLSPAVSAGETENIAVCIRVRPLNEREVRSRDCNVLRTINAMNVITITDVDGAPLSGKHNVFQYDHIYDETRSTRHMYHQVARRIVRSTLDGINGTIFAYGQTSSGKTYTMQGESSADAMALSPTHSSSSSTGILQLAVDDIFQYIERCDDRDFLLRVSFVEIYNEVVRDLLTTDAKGQNLKVREDPRKGVYVECREEIITNQQDILALLALGNQRRTVGHTTMNDRSSRSHSIFRIVIESKHKAQSRRESEDDVSGAVLVACLSLVDLAGSESVRHTAAEGIRQREAGNINKSLLTLSRVINALASSRPNAPFRDSKLTRLLQNSLDGNTRTLMICCVTPSDRFLDETKSTLQFAARAKTIQTSASVNEVLDDQAQLKRLKRQVHELQRLVSTDAIESLKAENAALMDEKSRHKDEYARLVGLILTSTTRSERATSASKGASVRTKRSRETWCPGDFPSAIGAGSVHALASPNVQPRKRRSNSDAKENVAPLNLLRALDDDSDASEDFDKTIEKSTLSRKRRTSREQTTQVLRVVELALATYRRESTDADAQALNDALAHVQTLLPSENDAERLTDVLHELQALMDRSASAQHLRGENELLQMEVDELQRKLSLQAESSSNQDDDDNAPDSSSAVDALQHELTESQQALTAERERVVALTEEKQAVEADLAAQIDAMRLAMAEQQRAFETEKHELERQFASQTDELTALRADEIARLERELQESIDAFQALEVTRLEHAQCESERVSLTAAATSLEEQLQQAATAHSDLEAQVKTLTDEKQALTETVSALESELAALAARTSAAELAAEERPSEPASVDIDNSDSIQNVSIVKNVEKTDDSDSDLASELQKLMHDMTALQFELEHVRAEKQTLTEANDAMTRELERLRQDLEFAANEKQASAINIEDLSAERAQLADALRSIKREMDELLVAHSRNAERLEVEVVALRAAKSERDADVEALEHKLAAVADESSRLKQKLVELDDDKQALRATVESLEQQLAGLKSSDQESTETSDAASLAHEIAEYEATVASQASAIEQLRAALAQSDDEHAALERRIEELADAEAQVATLEHQLAALQDASAAASPKATVDASTTTTAKAPADKAPSSSSSEDAESARQALALELETVTTQRRELLEELEALEAQLMAESQEKLQLTAAVEVLESKLRDADANSSDLARAVQAEAALLNELEQVTALMEKLEAENKALHAQLSGRGHESDGDESVAALHQRLAIEAELRATLELDVKSYEETLQIVRQELTSSSDASADLLEQLKRMEDDLAATARAKAQVERDCDVLRERLQRSEEEQRELRYQQTQRLVAADASDRSAVSDLERTVGELRAELAVARERLDAQTRAAADAAKTISDLEHELLAQRKAVAELDDALEATRRDATEQLARVATESSEHQDARAQAERRCAELTQQLEDVDASWRAREAELSQQVTAELASVKAALTDATSAKDTLKAQLADVEAQWRSKEQAMRTQASEEMDALREQIHDAQDELESYTKYADDEIHKLRASVEASDLELDEVARAAKATETALVAEREALEAKLAALVTSRDDAVEQLERELHDVSAKAQDADAAVADARAQVEAMKAAMEKLEGEAYEHRNEREDLSEALKSAQLEATHYRTALDSMHATRDELAALVETQKLRIDKLEKVKMTTETLALFRKLKRDREELQVRVQALERAATDASGRSDDKLRRTQAHAAELEQALEREQAKARDMRSELQRSVRDVMDKAQDEIRAMKDVVRASEAQVAALEERVATLTRENEEIAAKKVGNVTYLEQENLALLVQVRTLQKRLDERHKDAPSLRLDDDTLEHHHDASAAAATAILADASAVRASSDAAKSSASPFLLPLSSAGSSGADATEDGANALKRKDDDDARPACAQQ